jgi:predicted enzyme related to lactoylglutathione lyase
MSSPSQPRPGTIAWIDLTIEDAESTRDFYSQVTGWSPSPVKMGDYQDYCMNASDGETVAGICHARGENAGMPPQWMVYITVEDLDRSLEICQAQGGMLLNGPRDLGSAWFAVIEDPAGACAGLYQPKAPTS